MDITKIATPALLIDHGIMMANLKKMSELAERVGVKLRPHIKSHKIGEIALKQVTLSKNGITVAKLSEAEVMREVGIKDILIANQIIGEDKILRLSQLCRKCKVRICIDSKEGVDQLNKYLQLESERLVVLIEIDTGLKRCGVSSAKDLIALARYVLESPKLIFDGILSHSGNIYKASSLRAVYQIAAQETELMLEMAETLRASEIPVNEISIGSTPAAAYLGKASGITEFRPGNYVFNDNIQISLGIASIENCALSVVTTVISKPERGRIIIDAGSKCLGLDKGAHGSDLLKGYGLIKGYPQLEIERLSEEHGILRADDNLSIEIGDRLMIIPNHACTVTNLFDEAYVVKENRIHACWKIVARGKVT